MQICTCTKLHTQAPTELGMKSRIAASWQPLYSKSGVSNRLGECHCLNAHISVSHLPAKKYLDNARIMLLRLAL